MKRLTGWLDLKQPTLLLNLFTFPNKHEVWNKQWFLKWNNLSSAQQKHSKSQTHVTIIYSYNYLENNKGLTCPMTLNAEVMSPGIVNKKNKITLHQFIDAVCYLANQ